MHQHVTLIAAFGCQIFRTGQVFQDCFGIVGIFFAVGHKCAELQESRCRDSCGRRITRSLFTCRGIIVPVRNQVVRLYTFHNHVCNVNGFLQESRVPGFAIAGSVAVYSPRLAARPGRFCIFTLVCLFDFHASVIVIADHVIGGVVRTEVVFHSGLCMLYSHILILLISCQLIYVEQQVQVHHIVNDYGEVPRTEVPRAYTTDFRVETGAQIIRCFYEYGFNGVVRGEAESIAIAAIHHEAHVMGTFQLTYRVQDVGIFDGAFFQLFIAGQFIGIPKASGEESAGPVGNAAKTFLS